MHLSIQAVSCQEFYSNLKEAIKVAKQGGGVVVNYHQMYLWEKGVAQNYGKGSNIPMIKAKNKR